MWIRALLTGGLLALCGCGPTTTERLGLPPLETVASVDLGRYQGVWYEIASFPQRFQEGCEGTTANYQPGEGGEIVVLNRCWKEGFDGPVTEATGRARVVNAETNAELEVSFFGPFWGDYWVIDLGEDYEYAVVGHPGRDYLWILSRTAHLEPEVYKAILERLTAKGYELDRLVETVQP